MADEQNVDAGSETSGETAAVEAPQEATPAAEAAPAEAAPAADAPAADAGGAAEPKGNVVEPKIGDACTCPDGRAGTYQKLDESDTLFCTPTFDGN